MTVITTAEQGIEEGERRAERDLGAITNELEHAAASIADHTTSIESLKESVANIWTRLESIPKEILETLPRDLTSEATETLANLTHRIEQLESSTTHDDDETEPPEHEEEEEDREDPPARASASWLDKIY